jgi:hypothetical protein
VEGVEVNATGSRVLNLRRIAPLRPTLFVRGASARCRDNGATAAACRHANPDHATPQLGEDEVRIRDLLATQDRALDLPKERGLLL